MRVKCLRTAIRRTVLAQEYDRVVYVSGNHRKVRVSAWWTHDRLHNSGRLGPGGSLNAVARTGQYPCATSTATHSPPVLKFSQPRRQCSTRC